MTEQEQPTYSVYISGGLTPINQNVARQLIAQGHTVAIKAESANAANTMRKDGILPVYGDGSDKATLINDLKLLEAQVVLNLAPLAFNVPPFIRRDWDAAANTLKTESMALVEAAQAANVGLLVHASYGFLYADSDAPLDEDAALRSAHGHTFFSAALAVEKAVSEANGCILRTGYSFSSGADDVLRDVHQMLKRALVPSYVGSVDAPASWVHIDDIASAIVATVAKQPAGKVYNIASDSHLSPYQFLDVFGKKLGLSAPLSASELVGVMTIGKSQTEILKASFALSSELAKSELDWSPTFPDVDAALEDIMLTWRATV